ncbi:MAG: hypothetical protein JWO59_1267 [Chloroflexi bacterium]|nr:hypothetical protein [Chloroflexota bacterium]
MKGWTVPRRISACLLAVVLACATVAPSYAADKIVFKPVAWSHSAPAHLIDRIFRYPGGAWREPMYRLHTYAHLTLVDGAPYFVNGTLAYATATAAYAQMRHHAGQIAFVDVELSAFSDSGFLATVFNQEQSQNYAAFKNAPIQFCFSYQTGKPYLCGPGTSQSWGDGPIEGGIWLDSTKAWWTASVLYREPPYMVKMLVSSTSPEWTRKTAIAAFIGSDSKLVAIVGAHGH